MADGSVHAKAVRTHQKNITKDWVFVFVPNNDSDIGDYQSLLEALAPQKRKSFAHAARVVSILITAVRLVIF